MGLVLLFFAPALGGCQLPGFFADNFMPRPKVKAAYTPADQPTVVMVDDPRNLLPSGQYANLIAERVSLGLQQNKVITQVIRPQELSDLRYATEGFSSWPVDKVGRELGAGQVLYIVIDSFDYAGDSHEMYRPTAAARVKFVESATGRRLFPDQSELAVTTALSFKHKQFDRPTHSEQATLMHKLAENLAVDVAKRFYDHEQREVGSGYDDQ